MAVPVTGVGETNVICNSQSSESRERGSYRSSPSWLRARDLARVRGRPGSDNRWALGVGKLRARPSSHFADRSQGTSL
jgi:hypothetical protein